MKKCVIASVLVFGMASAAWAATALGEAGGYASIADAKKALDGVRGDESKCKGVVE